jgi:hypothetical protein
MITLVIFVSAAVLLGILLPLVMDYWGVIAGSVLLGGVWTWAGFALRGFGNPNARPAPTPSIQDWIFPFLSSALGAALILLGIYFLKAYFKDLDAWGWPFRIWAAVCGLVVLSIIGKQAYLNHTRRTFHLEVGYDSERPLDWQSVQVKVLGRSDSKWIALNDRVAVAPLRFGFKQSLAGERVIHFVPTALEFSFFGAVPVQFSLPQDAERITAYFQHSGRLSLYSGDTMIESRELGVDNSKAENLSQ